MTRLTITPAFSRVSFYGDSFTNGLYALSEAYTWRYLLTQAIIAAGGGQDVVHLAVTGNRMTDAATLAGIQVDLANRSPQLVVLEYGINDVTHLDVTESAFETAADAVIEACTAVGAQMLICGIPWCGVSMNTGTTYGLRAVAFSAVLRGLAETYQQTFVDLLTPTLNQSTYLSLPIASGGHITSFPPNGSLSYPDNGGDSFHYGNTGHAALYALIAAALPVPTARLLVQRAGVGTARTAAGTRTAASSRSVA